GILAPWDGWCLTPAAGARWPSVWPLARTVMALDPGTKPRRLLSALGQCDEHAARQGGRLASGKEGRERGIDRARGQLAEDSDVGDLLKQEAVDREVAVGGGRVDHVLGGEVRGRRGLLVGEARHAIVRHGRGLVGLRLLWVGWPSTVFRR